MTSHVSERERVLALVHRHGWNATSFQTLESGYRYFFDGDDACVAYFDTGRAWVVAGAPIAPTEALGRVAAAFVAAAEAQRKRCCFFATEDRFLDAARTSLRCFRIGEQPVWDPRTWADVLSQRKSLREQLRRARAKGVTVRELTAAELEESPTRDAIAEVATRWLATRGMAPMDFLVRVEPFTFPAHRRCFVAEREGQVIGFAGVVPVPARDGWFIEDLVRDPAAANGTGELLIDAVMRWAAGHGCGWLTLGLAPLAGEVRGMLRVARKGTALLYDFEGLHRFKAKLRPDFWVPIHLCHPPSQGALISLFDALVAFSRGGVTRFAIRSLLTGPTGVVRILAVLLVPWTIVLALAPAEHWFGGPWVKWAWVAFDVVVALGLFRLLRRPTTALVTALTSAVAADVALTTLQALLWNLPRAERLFEYAVIGLGWAAPMLAFIVLWGMRRSHLIARPPPERTSR